MKSVDPATLARIAELNQQLLAAQAPFSDNITEFNETCKELYDRLIRDPKERYDKCVEELNELYEKVQTAQMEFFDAQPDSWKRSEDGEAYAEWMEVWERSEEEFDIEDFDQLIEPKLLDESDFRDMPATPGDIKYVEEPAPGLLSPAASTRLKMCAAWRQAVAEGKTILGVQQWIAELPAAERKKYLPANYNSLPTSQQTQIDRALTLLDWDGK
jgi:hypothetical protein